MDACSNLETYSENFIRHMKINNESKIAMDIFHQGRKQNAIIAGLLGHFVDAALWEISLQADLLFI
ncbi:hypothetical protein [Clostridium sp. BL-8]|uniref:hypothetical protein n=1 Tax=Clostridium sp. BL-8 TaxID=349938 RepID=UPI00098CA221|nr:hypothetical protein [Clostridium sp. BL-8]OOM79911.1 hypothetical protein CLOBL_12790 [Clostridium sp. BL-8]